MIWTSVINHDSSFHSFAYSMLGLRVATSTTSSLTCKQQHLQQRYREIIGIPALSSSCSIRISLWQSNILNSTLLFYFCWIVLQEASCLTGSVKKAPSLRTMPRRSWRRSLKRSSTFTARTSSIEVSTLLWLVFNRITMVISVEMLT